MRDMGKDWNGMLGKVAAGSMVAGLALALAACGGAGAGDANATTDVTETEPAEVAVVEDDADAVETAADGTVAKGVADGTDGTDGTDATGDGSDRDVALDDEVVDAMADAAGDLKGVDIGTLRSDGTKLVYKGPDDISTIVFYYEGDTITREVVYFDYEDVSIANIAAQALKSDEADNDGIKSVAVDGTQVVVEYRESEFEGMSVSDIKTAYAYLQEVTQ